MSDRFVTALFALAAVLAFSVPADAGDTPFGIPSSGVLMPPPPPWSVPVIARDEAHVPARRARLVTAAKASAVKSSAAAAAYEEYTGSISPRPANSALQKNTENLQVYCARSRGLLTSPPECR